MKKTSIFMIAAALLLAGCTSKPTTSSTTASKISDDKTVISVNGIEITKQNLFESLLANYGTDQILNKALQAVADQEFNENDLQEIDQRVQSQLESYEKTFSNSALGSSFSEYVTDVLGYKSVEDYTTQVIRPNIVQSQLFYKYINDHYDQVVKEYGFSKVKIFTCETEVDALKAINGIDANEVTFDEAAMSVGGMKEAPVAKIISTAYTATDVDSKIISIASQFTKEGTFSSPIKISDTQFAVVQIISTDMSEEKDTVRSQLVSNQEFAIKVEASYLKAHNFQVFDSSIKEGIDSISESYLAEEK